MHETIWRPEFRHALGSLQCCLTLVRGQGPSPKIQRWKFLFKNPTLLSVMSSSTPGPRILSLQLLGQIDGYGGMGPTCSFLQEGPKFEDPPLYRMFKHRLILYFFV